MIHALTAAHAVRVPLSYRNLVRQRCRPSSTRFDHVESVDTHVDGIGPTTLLSVKGMAGPHEDRVVFESTDIILTLSLVSGWRFGTFHRDDAKQIQFRAGVVSILFGPDLHWLIPMTPRHARQCWLGLQWIVPSRKHVVPLLQRVTALWGGELVDEGRWSAPSHLHEDESE